ncbi:MAG: hypothetical protein ACRD26_10730, partial [Vicinamibacterales bacterium]
PTQRRHAAALVPARGHASGDGFLERYPENPMIGRTAVPRARWMARVLLVALAGSALLGSFVYTSVRQPAPAPASIFDALQFRGIGPAVMSGRINDLAVYEPNPAVFYVATATGALWKTVNNAITWEVLFDDEPDVVSIGAVAIQSDNPDVVWVGTGEANNRQSSSWGKGVYKSTDGGTTWRHLGLAGSRHIGRIVVDRRDANVVWVAALGSLWGPGRERGVFKSTDGGTTWKQVLFVDEDTGATDLVIDPSDARVLYAATYQRRRSPWGFNGGGPGSGIYGSRDGGDTWTRLTAGLPEGPMGRIGLDIYRKNPRHVYALVEHEREGGLYRSDDAGASWARISRTNPRPMYFSLVRVDPEDERRVYVGGVGLEISDDGGRTFRPHYGMHVDHHAFWINPRNTGHIIDGNDGGIAISYDRGAHWASVDNMDLGQFYHVGVDMDTPYRVYGGLQDNMAWGGSSATRSRLGIGNGEWVQVGEYDGMVALADPTDSNVLYIEAPAGRLLRVDRATNERKTITAQVPKVPRSRANWNAPLLVSPHDPATLLAGTERVYRSTDRGHSWEAISPDLTAGIDRDALTLMGVANRDIRLSRNDGVSAYSTLTSIDESPLTAGLLYVGADDGSVQMSRDGGAHWTRLDGRFPGVPTQTPVSAVVASRFEAGTAYVAFDGHANDDYRPYVYKTTDHGATWTSLAATLPAGHVVRCLTQDTKNQDVLYLGSEMGLFVSIDAGERWQRVRSNLPTVPIYQIVLHPRENDLILATHGRSIWILDDATPIQRAAESLAQAAYLFDPRKATQFRLAEDQQYWGEQRFFGQNPAFGAGISYYLRVAPRSIEVLVRDAAGEVVRRFDDKALANRKAAGINRIHWDLRYQPHTAPLVPVTPVSSLFIGNGIDGPFVPPGEYSVTLVIDGHDAGTRRLDVAGDPLIRLTDAERQTFQRMARQLYDMHDRALQIDATLRQLSDRLEATKGLAAAQVAGMTQGLQEIRARFAPGGRGGGGLRARIGVLESQVLASTSVPTGAQQAALEETNADLTALIESVNRIIAQVPASVGTDGKRPPIAPLRSVGSRER